MNSEIKSKQDEDFKWFRENYKWLYEKYGDCYAVISHKAVLCIAKTYADSVKHVMQKLPVGTYIVQKLGPTEDCFTVYVNEESK